MASTWTVLVVEDDAPTRTLMRSSLERLGLCVVEAVNGEEALRAFKASQADLVLLDAKLPKLDGFGVCKAIRRIKYGRDVPIIMVTSMADSEAAKRAKKAGVTDFVTKPVNWARLSERIRESLDAQSQVPSATA